MNKRMALLLGILVWMVFRLGLEIGNDRADDLQVAHNWAMIEQQQEQSRLYYAWVDQRNQLSLCKGESE